MNFLYGSWSVEVICRVLLNINIFQFPVRNHNLLVEIMEKMHVIFVKVDTIDIVTWEYGSPFLAGDIHVFAPWGEKLIAPLFASQNVDYIREEKEEQNKNMVHSKSN